MVLWGVRVIIVLTGPLWYLALLTLFWKENSKFYRCVTQPKHFFVSHLSSAKLGQSKWMVARVSIRGPLARQAHDPGCQANLCRWPASELVLIYTFAWWRNRTCCVFICSARLAFYSTSGVRVMKALKFHVLKKTCIDFGTDDNDKLIGFELLIGNNNLGPDSRVIDRDVIE